METDLKQSVADELDQSLTVLSLVRHDAELHAKLVECAERICATLQSGNKVLLAGNGGSAADAQHMAGELVSRLNFDRPGLCAFALTVDTTVLTAIGNDYGYEHVFSRQIQAVSRPGDLFWAYSTSGRSSNVLRGIEQAKKSGLFVIGFTGERGWADGALCDISIEVPSRGTQRIQEVHAVMGHIVCGLVESTLFPNELAAARSAHA